MTLHSLLWVIFEDSSAACRLRSTSDEPRDVRDRPYVRLMVPCTICSLIQSLKRGELSHEHHGRPDLVFGIVTPKSAQVT